MSITCSQAKAGSAFRRSTRVRIAPHSACRTSSPPSTPALRPQGRPAARPMAPILRREDGLIWFLSAGIGGKEQALAADPRVLLLFADGRRNHLSVEGTAALEHDRAVIAGLWSEHAEAYLPAGPDDPAIVAIRVVPDRADLWQGWSRLVDWGRRAAAVVLGRPPSAVGNHVRVGRGG
jgi:general stress protein 26